MCRGISFGGNGSWVLQRGKTQSSSIGNHIRIPLLPTPVIFLPLHYIHNTLHQKQSGLSPFQNRQALSTGLVCSWLQR